MGTNYYWHPQKPCDHCHRDYPPIHIGKSSFGWCFSLHVDPSLGIRDLDDWVDRFQKEGTYIKDEYDQELGVDEMLDIITNRSFDRDFACTPLTTHESRYSCPGPSGLLRHKLSPDFCIGHGSGTWDLMVSEFS